ncbi:MAG: hypothetical protein AAF402_14760 [Pseudomonadota bacterium]
MNTRRHLKSTCALLCAIALGTASAQVTLDDNQIRDFLAGSTIGGNQNETTWIQSFAATGQTTYTEVAGRPGSPSDGYWRVQDGQYCSQWPPSPQWACYDIELDGENIVFIPPSGGEPWPATRRER